MTHTVKALTAYKMHLLIQNLKIWLPRWLSHGLGAESSLEYTATLVLEKHLPVASNFDAVKRTVNML